MTIAVFHGSPRKGNTYRATKIFMEELQKHNDIRFIEFHLPEAMPKFCTGCQLCLGNPHETCPHASYVAPVLDAILTSDALLFATPHYGAATMSSSMKNLLDHLDFLTMNVSPRAELFTKKAFIITTGAGSTAAIRPIKKYLKNWGVNRVYALGFRIFIDKWDKMPPKKKAAFEKKLRQAAGRFYASRIGSPYLSTLLMYYVFKFIVKKYIGEDAYPYKYWQANGYLSRRPF